MALQDSSLYSLCSRWMPPALWPSPPRCDPLQRPGQVAGGKCPTVATPGRRRNKPHRTPCSQPLTASGRPPVGPRSRRPGTRFKWIIGPVSPSETLFEIYTLDYQQLELVGSLNAHGSRELGVLLKFFGACMGGMKEKQGGHLCVREFLPRTPSAARSLGFSRCF